VQAPLRSLSALISSCSLAFTFRIPASRPHRVDEELESNAGQVNSSAAVRLARNDSLYAAWSVVDVDGAPRNEMGEAVEDGAVRRGVIFLSDLLARAAQMLER
jgi:hypothetical protein